MAEETADQFTPPRGARLRVGTKVPRNLYLVTLDDEDGVDIGRIDHSPELAAEIVEAVNAWWIAGEVPDGDA